MLDGGVDGVADDCDSVVLVSVAFVSDDELELSLVAGLVDVDELRLSFL